MIYQIHVSKYKAPDPQRNAKAAFAEESLAGDWNSWNSATRENSLKSWHYRV